MKKVFHRQQQINIIDNNQNKNIYLSKEIFEDF